MRSRSTGRALVDHAAPGAAALVTCILLLGTGGCVPGFLPGGSEPGDDQNTITQDEIEHSGAENAWEALRRNGNALLLTESAPGDPGQVSHRGWDRLLGSNQVLLVVDGTHMNDVQYLRDIPAPSISYIRILTGAEGTAQYGAAGGNGVVQVETGSRTSAGSRSRR